MYQDGKFWKQHSQWVVDPRQSSPSLLVPRTRQPPEEQPEHTKVIVGLYVQEQQGLPLEALQAVFI